MRAFATVDLAQGRLDEAAAHLTVTEAYAKTAPPDRQHRRQVAIASLKLSLARRRGHLAECPGLRNYSTHHPHRRF